MHEINVTGYNAATEEKSLNLGTAASYGVEKLHITFDAAWDDLSKSATFNCGKPGRGLRPVTRMIDENGIVDVPQEATAVATKDGTITLLGVAPGSGQRISVDIPYTVTGHAAVPGQTAEDKPSAFEQILEAAQGAERAAQKAQEAAGTAKDEAQAGAEAASKQATASAQAAEKSAAQAEASASEAQGHSAQAGQYAQQTADAVALGQQAAGDARTDRLAAESAQQETTKHEQAAKDAATDAGTAKTAAEGSATAAAESAELAKQQADAAGKSAILAQSAADTATKAKADAMDAQTAAEDAQDKALTAQTCAETAQGKAEDAAKTATGAADRAEEAAAQVQPIDDAAITTTSPWSSKQIVDTLCPPLEESGNPVVCYPVAGYPLGMKAKWEPVQEGSGEPYPAGGGPNLLDISQCTPTVGKPYGLTLTIDGDIIKASGIPSSEVTEEGQYSFAVASCAQAELRGKGYKVTPFAIKGKISNAWGLRTEDESSLAISAELTPGVNTDIQLRLMVSKDTPTAYAPYANIRPISGKDSVAIERLGENLLNIVTFAKLTKSGITYEYVANGGVRISGTATTTVDSPTFAVGHLPPGKYYGLDAGAGISASIVVQRNGSNLWLNAKGVFEILAGDTIKYWYMIATNGATLDTTVYPYIVPGTTAPATYIPYTGSTTTLTLPETVYGGEVDAVRGDGNENTKIITLDGNELKFSQSNIYLNLPMHSAPGIANKGGVCCSHFNSRLFGINTNYEFCFLLAHDIADLFANVDELNAYLAAQNAAGTPVQVCYKLAEPVPFTATGGDEITALSGVNTILTDADTVAVTGREDIVHAISELRTAKATDVEG